MASTHKRKSSEVFGDRSGDSDRPYHKARLEREPIASPVTQPISLAYPSVSDSKLRGQPPAFQLPTQIVSFSYDEEHRQLFDDSAMRYYVDPPRNARLDYGYDRWIRKPDDRGRLDPLLKAIQKARGDKHKSSLVPDNGIVCWRGIMTKILIAPYEERDGWDLNIMFVNGVLYFEEHLTESKLRDKNNMQPRQRQQTYYGYAFESYCTSEIATRPPGWGGDVNTNVQWCSVVRTKLGDSRIVIGGEVDCVRGKYTGRTDTFVELKTSMSIRGPQDEARFEKKLLKFYFQSFLLGVPEIVVGFRTPSGVVTTLQKFKTMEIPRLIRGKPGAWDPSVCLDWGGRFLTFLKSLLVNSGSARVWRVTFTPGTGVTAYQLDKEGEDDVVNGEDRVGFLPSWYWNEILASHKPNFTAIPAQPPNCETQSMISPTTTISGWHV